jgi:hypothetical protein
MKKLSIVLIALTSFTAQATGGFSCYTKNEEIQVWSETGRMYGSPIISKVTMKVRSSIVEFKKEQVLGYWNFGKEFKMAIVDSDFNNLVLKIEAKKSPFSYKFKGHLIDGDDKVKITCEFE